MGNVVNPFEVIQLDILYYLLILALGPALLWYEFRFRPKLKRIHDAYHHSGIEIQGLVTHRKVTVYRGSITRIERRREFEMRYAYKVPGTDTIVIKDFVHVKQAQLDQRLFTAVILPGQPQSGVPEFLVKEYSDNIFWKGVRLLVGLPCSGLCVYVFHILLTLALYCESDTLNSTRYCIIHPWTYFLATLIIIAVGFGFAFLVYRAELQAVPGCVWLSIHANQVTRPTDYQPPNIDLTQIDDRPIPMVEAVALLDDRDEEVAGGSIAETSASDPSSNTPMEAQSVSIAQTAAKEEELPQASAVELV